MGGADISSKGDDEYYDFTTNPLKKVSRGMERQRHYDCAW